MPKIATDDILNYGGALQKIHRLGLNSMFEEIKQILTAFELLVEERKDANGGKEVRKQIDARFQTSIGWTKKVSGDIDWTKCRTINGTRVCIGVEIQCSNRSDMVIIDLIHLRRGFKSGAIDVGVLVVPNNTLGYYLTDRAPRIRDAVRHIEEAKIEDLPIVVIGIGHDGPGPPLPKQPKRARKAQKPSRRKK